MMRDHRGRCIFVRSMHCCSDPPEATSGFCGTLDMKESELENQGGGRHLRRASMEFVFPGFRSSQSVEFCRAHLARGYVLRASALQASAGSVCVCVHLGKEACGDLTGAGGNLSRNGIFVLDGKREAQQKETPSP